MEREKANIRERFPDAYDEYSANVPAFVPRVTPWRSGNSDEGGFDSGLYMKHGEWKAGITYLLVMAWLALRVSTRLVSRCHYCKKPPLYQYILRDDYGLAGMGMSARLAPSDNHERQAFDHLQLVQKGVASRAHPHSREHPPTIP